MTAFPSRRAQSLLKLLRYDVSGKKDDDKITALEEKIKKNSGIKIYVADAVNIKVTVTKVN